MFEPGFTARNGYGCAKRSADSVIVLASIGGGVSFQKGGEVRLALVPPAPPAMRVQEIGGRGERVGRAADQVAAASAVCRDAVLEIKRTA